MSFSLMFSWLDRKQCPTFIIVETEHLCACVHAANLIYAVNSFSAKANQRHYRAKPSIVYKEAKITWENKAN